MINELKENMQMEEEENKRREQVLKAVTEDRDVKI